MYHEVEFFRTVTLPALRARIGSDERGASMVEYALVLALVAVVGVVGLTFLGNTTNEKLVCAGGGISGDPNDNGTAGDTTDDYYDVNGVAGYQEGTDKLASEC